MTPLPPQNTGIANYVYDLLVGLSKFDELNITVITNIDGYINDKINILNIAKEKEINYSKFQLINYQLGNNKKFHDYMYSILQKYGGIVHLHDIVLHEVLAKSLNAVKQRKKYLSIMRKLYGEKISIYLKELFEQDISPWKTAIAIQLPCFEEFVSLSDACIVHSDYNAKKIHSKFTSKSVYKISQLYNIPPMKLKNITSTIRLGVFGGVEVNRKVETILKIFSNILPLNKKLELIIVGSISQKCKHIVDLPKEYSIDKNVTFYKYVDNEQFYSLLKSTDLLIALRSPTVGETSAVVMQALQLYVPVVVSDIGWYSELPDFVDKISNENLEEDLTLLLKQYITNTSILDSKKKDIKVYADENLCFEIYVEKYANILKQHILKVSNKIIVSKLSSHIKDLNCPLKTIYKVSNKVENLF